MRKIRDVLRLKLDAKLSHEQIAGALGISKGVVTKYVGLAAAAGLDWPTVQDADEITLERRLLVAPQKPRNHVQPDYGRLHQELRRKGMTLMLLWEEYRAEHADRQTYAYSQFCDNYRRFARQLKRSMRQIHRAGEKLFIDYAGPTIALTDGSRAHIFVAAMGASSYTFAFATPRETMADWLESTARALSFYGGVTQLIVPDNPRALISDANRYEPRSNDTGLDFARRYCPAEVYNFRSIGDPVVFLKKTTDSLGADVCIDAVGGDAAGSALHTLMGTKLKLEGGSAVALHWAINSVKKGGIVSIVGVYGPTGNLIPIGNVLNKGITIRANQASVKRLLPKLIAHIEAGRLNPKELITHKVPLEEAADAYHLFSAKLDECIKPVLVPPTARA